MNNGLRKERPLGHLLIRYHACFIEWELLSEIISKLNFSINFADYVNSLCKIREPQKLSTARALTSTKPAPISPKHTTNAEFISTKPLKAVVDEIEIEVKARDISTTEPNEIGDPDARIIVFGVICVILVLVVVAVVVYTLKRQGRIQLPGMRN